MSALSHNFQAILIAVASLLALGLPGCSGQTTYTLIPTRQSPNDPLRNSVQLRCRNEDTTATLSFDDAMYWVDNTDRDLRDLLREEGQTPDRVGLNRFQFTITQELEGRYFCGPNIFQTSPMLLLITYPPFTDGDVDFETVAVQEGSTATLPPLISPGALLELYFIVWRRDSTSETLAQVEVPRDEDSMTNGRYSVDPNSFALTIQSVQLGDRGLYLGELGVRDGGSGGQRLMDNRLSSTGINLEVYVLPTFLESPTNQVVSTVDTQSVNFTCRVQAYPRPTITWYNEEEQISDGGRYMISETDSMQDDMFVVWGNVVISDLRSEDSGRIRCVATISVQAEQQPPSAESAAYLSVLGDVEDISTFITLQSGAIFLLDLFRPMEAEVQLYIQYTDVESGNVTNETTRSRYAQLEEITFFIENIPQSYRMFTIDVALISGDLQGPLHSDPTVHDLTIPTELSETLIIYLVPCIFSLLVLITIAIMTVTVVCVRFCSIRCADCCYSASRRTEKNSFLDSRSAVPLDKQEQFKKDYDELLANNQALTDELAQKNEQIQRLSDEIDGFRCDIRDIRCHNRRLSEENDRLWDQLKKVSDPGDTPPLIRRPSGISGGPSWPGSVTEKDAVPTINEDPHMLITADETDPTTLPPKNTASETLPTGRPDERRGAPPNPGEPDQNEPRETITHRKRSLLHFCCARETAADQAAREKFNNIRRLYAGSMSVPFVTVDGQTGSNGSMVTGNGPTEANGGTENSNDSTWRQAASGLRQPPPVYDVVCDSYTVDSTDVEEKKETTV